MKPIDFNQWDPANRDALRKATEDDTPVLDFLLNALWYGVPAVVVLVIFLAALRILFF